MPRVAAIGRHQTGELLLMVEVLVVIDDVLLIGRCGHCGGGGRILLLRLLLLLLKKLLLLLLLLLLLDTCCSTAYTGSSVPVRIAEISRLIRCRRCSHLLVVMVRMRLVANSDCSNGALMVLSVVVMMLKDGRVMRMRRRRAVSNHWHPDCCSVDGHSAASASVRMMRCVMCGREHGETVVQ